MVGARRACLYAVLGKDVIMKKLFLGIMVVLLCSVSLSSEVYAQEADECDADKLEVFATCVNGCLVETPQCALPSIGDLLVGHADDVCCDPETVGTVEAGRGKNHPTKCYHKARQAAEKLFQGFLIDSETLLAVQSELDALHAACPLIGDDDSSSADDASSDDDSSAESTSRKQKRRKKRRKKSKRCK